jgi:predicted CoA-binding protein
MHCRQVIALGAEVVWASLGVDHNDGDDVDSDDGINADND